MGNRPGSRRLPVMLRQNSDSGTASPPRRSLQAPSAPPRPSSKKSDPQHWLRAVLKRARKAQKDLSDEDAIHDLRTSLRRCRSVANALAQIDPAPAWRALDEEAERLLDGMSDLRDAQVGRRLVSKFHMGSSAAGKALLTQLDDLEAQGQRRAAKRLRRFDVKRWRKWSHNLPQRAARIQPDGPVVELLALEAWKEAFERHRFALRSRSNIAIHKLRVRLKRLRYFTEIFLPLRDAAWDGQFRKLQDLLGDIHDMDVLRARLARIRRQIPEQQYRLWQSRIATKRDRFFARYRAMVRRRSPWELWRKQLPPTQELDRHRLALLAVWASYLDPHSDHSRRVTRLALEIYDGLEAAGLSALGLRAARTLLEAAALVHDVGLRHAHKNHQKFTYKMVRKRTPPPGWTTERMELMARIARYHRGAMPLAGDGQPGSLSARQSAAVLFLSGILRLAVVMAGNQGRATRRVSVRARDGEVVLRALGYDGGEPWATHLAAARHLLETELDRPVMILPADKPAVNLQLAGN
jgi:CHAD domain-containing protein